MPSGPPSNGLGAETHGIDPETNSRAPEPETDFRHDDADLKPPPNRAAGFDYRQDGLPETNRRGPLPGRRPDEASPLIGTASLRAPDRSATDSMRQAEQLGGPAESGNIGIEMGFLPPDQRTGLSADLLSCLPDPNIEEDTEAAEAIRANAEIKVGKVSKAARSINAQSVRRLVKRATLRGKSGNTRGKPPRIPPGRIEDPDNVIFMVEEGDDEFSSDDSQDEHGDISTNSDESNLDQAGAQPKFAEIISEDGTPKVPHGSSHKRDDAAFVDEIPSSVPTSHTKDKDKSHKHSHIADDAKDIPAEVVTATVEAGKKFLGAVDPHNMLQIQRWRRKKKNGEKKKRKSYVKGKVIDGKHELYTLSLAVMHGVRTSIAKTNTLIFAAEGRRVLTPQDFMTEEKYEFAPKGSVKTPPHQLSHTFKFKDYAPMAFAYLRRLFGVNEYDFLHSVCGNANFIEFISNAKSGQFFFYSSDGKYMIKTMTNSESKFLRRILPHYFRHCTRNPNTLITKFLGMYRVKLYHLRRNVKFVIMNSVYHTDKFLQTFYDLKGSVIGREAKPGQDVLKDNDLRAKLPEESMSLPEGVRARLRAQIESDCRFLEWMQIMDYSMLIGIHHIPQKPADAPNNVAKAGFRIRDRPRHMRSHSRTDSAGYRSDHTEDQSHGGSDGHHSSVRSERITGSDHLFSPDAKRAEKMEAHGETASTQKMLTEFRECGLSVSNYEMTGLFEDEEDCSYLEGSEKYTESTHHEQAKKRYQEHPKYADIEMKKEETVEQLYWPFHRFYDINGHRRMTAKACFRCNSPRCVCDEHKRLIEAWNLPDFEPPISDRKDGGLMMDTSGSPMPMVYKSPTGDRNYGGKIFYIGIIDVLQQYTARKRAETSYRRASTLGNQDPSCVHPRDYADRFIRFFDEYSQQARPREVGRPVPEEAQLEVKVSEDGEVIIPNGPVA